MLGVWSTINVVRQVLIALGHQTPTVMAFLQTHESAQAQSLFSKRSPDGAKRNPGSSLADIAAPDCASLHPGYSRVICPSGRLVSSLLFRIFRKIFVAT